MAGRDARAGDVSDATVERPLEPLWRGLLFYRVLTLVTTTAVVLWTLDEHASPAGAVAVQAGMAAWTAVIGRGYLGGMPRGRLALADLVVTSAVIATTPLVQTAAQIDADAPVSGSIWTPCAVLACALAFDVRGGLGGAVVLCSVLLAVSARAEAELGDIQLIVLVAVSIGYASTVLRRQAERLRTAIGQQAAMAERERLARVVHDGVLQVLGYVHRRGQELGGDAASLASMAGEQEVVLRTLLTTGGAPTGADGLRDVADALRMLGVGRVSVSTPAHPVRLPAAAVGELVAVVGAALANVARHVGPDAPAWVLVEDLGDAVEISVRDEGPGIPDGRLDEAAEQGRLGVARSMRGRVRDLGATITCETGPGRGTEWIIRMPREQT
ncbi:histidine kinase [Pseudonocardia sp. KRD-182]|nr:histidine kinase [Pseudonocardia oceani]